MKLKGVTRRAVMELPDNELTKLHAQLHAEEGNIKVNEKKREKDLWEAHNIVIAEMQNRGITGHKTPIGADFQEYDTEDSPADSDLGADSAKQHVKESDGASSNKPVKLTVLGKTLVLDEVRDVLRDCGHMVHIGNNKWVRIIPSDETTAEI